ncbi:hypothetical protein N8T08_001897 [Aspergillus melleus]|uniref:Uncharacterized protein n=1 Tax=Aspergillus melleus TaxID=138277 RepID=A0ACC3B9I8_9EURO|nr:hypothetical protein N8T08_001897 [Aspergillus melleus]
MKTSLLTSITLAFSTAMAVPYPVLNAMNGGLARAENEQAMKRNDNVRAIDRDPTVSESDPSMKRNDNGPVVADNLDAANEADVPRVVNVKETPANKRAENIADMANAPGLPYIVDIPETSGSKKGENVADVINAADVPSAANDREVLSTKGQQPDISGNNPQGANGV